MAVFGPYTGLVTKAADLALVIQINSMHLVIAAEKARKTINWGYTCGRTTIGQLIIVGNSKLATISRREPAGTAQRQNVVGLYVVIGRIIPDIAYQWCIRS